MSSIQVDHTPNLPDIRYFPPSRPGQLAEHHDVVAVM